ncbi:MAG: polysaccharide deacetylase family protein [Actinomycetota bacterium]
MKIRTRLSPGMFLPVLYTQPAGDRSVAITVDDAPMPDSMPGMLDALDAFGAKATFFMSGCRAALAEELVAETVRRGHAVYAHGWEHIRLDRAGTHRLVADFDRCEALLAKYRPTPAPYLVRMPYNGGHRKVAVHRALAKWAPGCQIAHWRLSTEDHLIAPACISAAEVEARCRAEAVRVAASPDIEGAVILMHDQPINERPGGELKPAVTVALMRELVAALAARGVAMTTLKPDPHPPSWRRWVLV